MGGWVGCLVLRQPQRDPPPPPPRLVSKGLGGCSRTEAIAPPRRGSRYCLLRRGSGRLTRTGSPRPELFCVRPVAHTSPGTPTLAVWGIEGGGGPKKQSIRTRCLDRPLCPTPCQSVRVLGSCVSFSLSSSKTQPPKAPAEATTPPKSCPVHQNASLTKKERRRWEAELQAKVDEIEAAGVHSTVVDEASAAA